ncbi:MAG: winged helix-turn-helix transcriptional regulator [Nanoarchaeota archaeon]|nr:winged helix-turn-helix transcriptional regulator [Nanoarchaeota archaeon]
MNTKILEKLGLDEKEIQVYLCLLRTGSTTASKISKETNIDRATCYRYLDSLIHKGLVSQVIQNNVKYFQAAHPEKILKDLKEKENEFKKILPELITLSNLPKEETTAEVYKGKDGLKTVLREILRNKQNHLVLGEEGHFQDLLPIFFEQFVNECKKNKIKEKILCTQSIFNKVKKFDYEYSKIKVLPSGTSLPTTTLIYDNKIVLLNWAAPYNAIIISNKNLTDTYRSHFELLWKISK